MLVQGTLSSSSSSADLSPIVCGDGQQPSEDRATDGVGFGGGFKGVVGGEGEEWRRLSRAGREGLLLSSFQPWLDHYVRVAKEKKEKAAVAATARADK